MLSFPRSMNVFDGALNILLTKETPHMRFYCFSRALLYQGERWKPVVYSLCQLQTSYCTKTTADISSEGNKFQFSEPHSNLYVDWISSCDSNNKRDVNILDGLREFYSNMVEAA